jgi:hypothetical protein
MSSQDNVEREAFAKSAKVSPLFIFDDAAKVVCRWEM